MTKNLHKINQRITFDIQKTIKMNIDNLTIETLLIELDKIREIYPSRFEKTRITFDIVSNCYDDPSWLKISIDKRINLITVHLR